MHMILTTYSLIYPQISVSERRYEALYPYSYRDIQELYRGYTHVMHRSVFCNVPRETLQRFWSFV